ncbi:MAG: hypothetical protein A2138_10270 [Deltaproteobacteria bacterium RBG_16_71_12]|nr:MAG: hypothetical protein A2138_10270 [Deltaproteobacteria bacterium RBG_16_71_12]
MADPLDDLTAALSRLDDDGNRVYPVDDVRHAIPLIVLMNGLDLAAQTEGVQQLVLETLLAAGVDPEAKPAPEPEEAIAALASWYQEHPVSAAVLDEIRKAFEGPTDGPSKAARALLGTEEKRGVLGGGERPAGTIPAALGRLQTSAFQRPRGRDPGTRPRLPAGVNRALLPHSNVHAAKHGSAPWVFSTRCSAAAPTSPSSSTPA